MTGHVTVHLWPGVDYQLTIDRRLVATRTQFQSLEICDTRGFGRALFLDEKIQSAESDEFIYHESLVHPALIAHPNPRRVYIAGGGEGATLRDILQHRSVERAVMVDIDGEAVRFARDYMQSWHHGAFDDPRTTLAHDDARAYLAARDDQYDVIVVDVTDPVSGGPSYLLFTEEFYRLARSRLAPGGILAVQAESTSLPIVKGHAAIIKSMRGVFPIVRPFAAFVPSFGEPWGFAIASDSLDPLAIHPTEVDARIAQRGLVCRHYDGETHTHMFAVPRAVRDAIARAPRGITDNNPLIVQ